MRWSNSEGARFLIAGGANTLLGYGLYLLLNLALDYRIAYTLSYVAGIGISFVLNSLYVFRQPLRWQHLAVYPLVYVLQYAAGLATVWLFVSVMGWPEALAPWAAVAASLPLTFIATRFVLRKRPDAAAEH